MAQLPTVIALKNSPHTKEQLEAWKGKLSEFKKILKVSFNIMFNKLIFLLF